MSMVFVSGTRGQHSGWFLVPGPVCGKNKRGNKRYTRRARSVGGAEIVRP